jgi:hypothetical protein
MAAVAGDLDAPVGTSVQRDVGRDAPAPLSHQAESWLRRHWPWLALTAAAAVIAVVSRHLIYPALSWNRDEATYLWQVELLRSGRIFGTDGGWPNFFWPWLAGLRDGQFFSQYTAGWPVVLLAATEGFGSPDVAIALGAALAVLGTYLFTHEVTRDRRLALVTATLMLACPILVIQGGVYLPYLFSLGIGLCFATALLAGLRTGSGWSSTGSGVLLGVLFVTRPYDAVLWALPLGAYGLFVGWRDRRHVVSTALWVAVGAVPFVALQLLYNHRVSGSFTTFPQTAKDPLDDFGFGVHRLMPAFETFDYSVRVAIRSSAHNLRTLPSFFVGGWVGGVAALVGVWLRRRDRSTLVLLAIAASFVVGYFFFWGNLLSGRAATLSGPIYYIPLYAPACVFAAASLIALWERRRALAVVTLVVLLGFTMGHLVSRVVPNHRISEAQVPWKHATRSLHEYSLVFVEYSGRYLMHLNPYSRNPHHLNDPILFATDHYGADLDLIAAYPNRVPYLQRTSDPRFDDAVVYHDAPAPRVELVPLTVLEGRRATFRVRLTTTKPGDVVAYLRVGDQTAQRTLAVDAPRGRTFETDFTVSLAGTPEAATSDATVTSRVGTIKVGSASTAGGADPFAGTRSQAEFSYRLDGETMELLTPGRTFRGRTSRRDRHLPVALRLPELDVQVTTVQ